MNCKICNKKTQQIFEKTVLDKYRVKYYKCENCKFIFTETPYWLNEAYKNPFTKSDTGLLSRPLTYGKVIENIILSHFKPEEKFLDYGGGNGLMVRYLRDLGFNFYRQDKFAENIYASYFDISDLTPAERKFEIITSIEVAEHLVNPIETFEEIFKLGDSIFFTTFLQPNNSKELSEWWYISPQHGQHISFYHIETLRHIANSFGKNIYSNGFDMHLITSKKIKNISFEPGYLNETGPARYKNIMINLINKVFNKIYPPITLKPNNTLTVKDMEYIQNKLLKK